MKTSTLFSSFALTLGLSCWSQGAVIVGMNSITYTGTAAEFYGNENTLINGSGLSDANVTAANIDTLTHANFTSGNSWVTVNNGGDFFDASPPGTVVFEIIFDQTYQLTDFYSWAYTGGGVTNGNMAKSYTIEYGVGDFLSGSENVTLPQPSGNEQSSITFGSALTADRVRLTVTDNFAAELVGGDRVGLSEFRFVAVPEPSSVSLLGLAGVSLLFRRRR